MKSWTFLVICFVQISDYFEMFGCCCVAYSVFNLCNNFNQSFTISLNDMDIKLQILQPVWRVGGIF